MTDHQSLVLKMTFTLLAWVIRTVGDRDVSMQRWGTKEKEGTVEFLHLETYCGLGK